MADKNYLEQYDDGNPNTSSGNEIQDEQIDELAGLVGHTLFLFNSLESDLDRLIANAINGHSHQPGYTIIAELQAVFTKKILVFKALYGPPVGFFDDGELAKLFESIWGRLFQIKDIRNEVAHANWLAGNNTYEVRLRISTDEGGPYTIRKTMTPDFLKRQIATLEEIIEALNEFEEAFENEATGH